mgnify:CR=1 FL=1
MSNRKVLAARRAQATMSEAAPGDDPSQHRLSQPRQRRAATTSRGSFKRTGWAALDERLLVVAVRCAAQSATGVHGTDVLAAGRIGATEAAAAAKAIAAANGSPARPQGDLIAPRAVDRTGTPPTPTRNPFETPANDEAARAKAASALTYLAAGVDIDAGNELVERIKPACKSTRRPGCDSDLGGFGGLFDLDAAGYGGEETILVGATDGVGTKLKGWWF